MPERYNNILPIQIKKIHIAKSQLGLDDQQYRDILSGFTNKKGDPCSSSKELNYAQAEVLLNTFEKLGFKQSPKGTKLKYEEYSGRDAKFATPKQMRSVDVLWFTSINVREKTDEAMNNFIHRIAGVSHISFLLTADVHKVRKAIQNLKSERSRGLSNGGNL